MAEWPEKRETQGKRSTGTADGNKGKRRDYKRTCKNTLIKRDGIGNGSMIVLEVEKTQEKELNGYIGEERAGSREPDDG